MCLTSDLHCPKASLETGAGTELSEESSECIRQCPRGNRGQGIRAPACTTGTQSYHGSSPGSTLSNTSIRSRKFLLKSNLNPILFCLSLRKNKKQVSLMLFSKTLKSLLSLGQTHPILESYLLAFFCSSRIAYDFPVGTEENSSCLTRLA